MFKTWKFKTEIKTKNKNINFEFGLTDGFMPQEHVFVWDGENGKDFLGNDIKAHPALERAKSNFQKGLERWWSGKRTRMWTVQGGAGIELSKRLPSEKNKQKTRTNQ